MAKSSLYVLEGNMIVARFYLTSVPTVSMKCKFRKKLALLGRVLPLYAEFYSVGRDSGVIFFRTRLYMKI